MSFPRSRLIARHGFEVLPRWEARRRLAVTYLIDPFCSVHFGHDLSEFDLVAEWERCGLVVRRLGGAAAAAVGDSLATSGPARGPERCTRRRQRPVELAIWLAWFSVSL